METSCSSGLQGPWWPIFGCPFSVNCQSKNPIQFSNSSTWKVRKCWTQKALGVVLVTWRSVSFSNAAWRRLQVILKSHITRQRLMTEEKANNRNFVGPWTYSSLQEQPYTTNNSVNEESTVGVQNLFQFFYFIFIWKDFRKKTVCI